MTVRDCKNCRKLKEINSLYNKQISLHKRLSNELESVQDKLDVAKENIHSLKDRIRLLIMENDQLKNTNQHLTYLRIKEKEEMEKLHAEHIQEVNDRYSKEIEELKAKIVKLESQKNKNSRNSSKPSSLEIGRPKIQNNREKSGLKPGGQTGHKGAHLSKMEPTRVVKLSTPAEITENDNYYKTGRIIKKQLVKIGLVVEVIEYSAEEYRERRTGKRFHAPFPEGMVNEVTYDASVKAVASLLHTHGNMSYEKVRETISDLTDGKINISCGTLAVLEKEFSKKTEAEREEIKRRMLEFPFAHIDGTSSRVNGKLENTIVFTSPAGTLLYAREHKGFQGVKDTAAEKYSHTLVHDGESTFFNYGESHQGCLVHEMRYLLGSVENEPHLTWAAKMRALLQEMMHTVNEAKRSGQTKLDKKVISDFYQRYDKTIELAQEEYKKNPPNMKYYPDGKRTMNRLYQHRDSYLYFLNHIEVPATNNAAELVARKVKMHSKQSGGYRNRDYEQYYCDTLSVLESSAKGRFQTLYEGFSK